MRRRHHLYVYPFIVLLPILLLLYLGSVEADVYAAGPRQQPASFSVSWWMQAQPASLCREIHSASGPAICSRRAGCLAGMTADPHAVCLLLDNRSTISAEMAPNPAGLEPASACHLLGERTFEVRHHKPPPLAVVVDSDELVPLSVGRTEGDDF